MTIYDQLLNKILSVADAGGPVITVDTGVGAGIYSYFLGGGHELQGHVDQRFLAQITTGNIDQVFFLEWSFANSATMLESGIHLFLSEAAAIIWRDNHSMEIYRNLDINRMSEERACRELSLLEDN